MKKVLLTSLVVFTSFIAGCSTESDNSRYFHSATADNLVISPTSVAYSPASVVIYPNQQAVNKLSYENIAVAKVSLYNQYDIRRQQAQVNQILKEQAHTLGGNAAILLDKQDTKYLYAQIIRVNPTATSPLTSATPPK